MITLLSTDKLIAYMTEAKNTSEPTFDTAFYTNKPSDADVTESTTFGNLNSTTDVDLVAAPSATYNRNITHINICNIDVIGHTIIIAKDVSGTDTILFKIFLNPNETWVYPVPANKERILQNSLTKIGRTLTVQSETLQLSDIGTQLMSNYTGTGDQSILIPVGVFSVGFAIDVIRKGRTFLFSLENGATQSINIEKYSGLVHTRLTLILTAINNGIEEWLVVNGSLRSTLQSREVGLIAVGETADYIAYAFNIWSSNTTNTESNRTLFKVVKKSDNSFIYYIHGSNVKGCFVYEDLELVVFHCSYNTKSTANTSSDHLSLRNTGLITNCGTFSTYSAKHFQKMGYHLVSGKILSFQLSNIGNGVITNMYERQWDNTTSNFIGSRTYNDTHPNNYGSSCFNGVNATQLGESYILITKSTTAAVLLDAWDLSLVSSINGLEYSTFLHQKPVNNKTWYVRDSNLGYWNWNTNVQTEFAIGFTLYDLFQFNHSHDVVNNKVYISEISGMRYIVLDLVTEQYTIINISADLGGKNIIGISVLPSRGELFIHTELGNIKESLIYNI